MPNDERKERRKAYQARYWVKNRDRINAKRRERYKNDPERLAKNQADREKYRNDPEYRNRVREKTDRWAKKAGDAEKRRERYKNDPEHREKLRKQMADYRKRNRKELNRKRRERYRKNKTKNMPELMAQ